MQFGPYLDLLPTRFDEFPINFSASELSYLKETQFIYALDKRRNSYREDYDLICQYIPAFSKYSLDEYQEAMTAC